MALLNIVISLVVISFIDFSAEGGECCRGYTDLYGDWQSSKWCSDYCCNKWKELECCDNIFFQAGSSDRLDTCAEWWSDHAWVPVLISIGCIAAITLCCFGCFKLCSNNNNRTGVVVTTAHQPAVIMMAGHQTVAQPYPSSSVQNPGAYSPGAYPAGAYPGGPPPYDMGIPQKAQ